MIKTLNEQAYLLLMQKFTRVGWLKEYHKKGRIFPSPVEKSEKKALHNQRNKKISYLYCILDYASDFALELHRLKPLEEGNEYLSLRFMLAILEANGVALNLEPKEAKVLAHLLRSNSLSQGQLACVLAAKLKSKCGNCK